MVTGGLVWRATVISTSTRSPGGIPCGTVAITWYMPTDPVGSPANDTGVSTPPIVTVTALTTALVSGVAEPAGTGGETWPRPAQEITIRSPAAAGLPGSASLLLLAKIAPCPTPD